MEVSVVEQLNSILSDPHKFFFIAGSLLIGSIITIALLRILVKLTIIASLIAGFVMLTKLPVGDISSQISGIFSNANGEFSGFINALNGNFSEFSVNSLSSETPVSQKRASRHQANAGRPNVFQTSQKQKFRGNLTENSDI